MVRIFFRHLVFRWMIFPMVLCSSGQFYILVSFNCKQKDAIRYQGEKHLNCTILQWVGDDQPRSVQMIYNPHILLLWLTAPSSATLGWSSTCSTASWMVGNIMEVRISSSKNIQQCSFSRMETVNIRKWQYNGLSNLPITAWTSCSAHRATRGQVTSCRWIVLLRNATKTHHHMTRCKPPHQHGWTL